MMREKSSYSFLRSLVQGRDHSFFKDLMSVFCTVGGTLVYHDVILRNCSKAFLDLKHIPKAK
jgi:hypothetical protein